MSVLLRKSTSVGHCKLTVTALVTVAACFSEGCVAVYAIRTYQPDPPIILAAEHGDVKTLRAQLDSGVNPDTRDLSQQTALMIAALRGDTEAVGMLLDRHAKVDLERGYHMTALMYAAVLGYSDVVRQLLESGADVNHADEWGQTALLMAIRSKDLAPPLLKDGSLSRRSKRAAPEDVVRTLLEHGANVHVLDSQGHDALFYASGDCQSEVVKLLKSAGAAGRC